MPCTASGNRTFYVMLIQAFDLLLYLFYTKPATKLALTLIYPFPPPGKDIPKPSPRSLAMQHIPPQGRCQYAPAALEWGPETWWFGETGTLWDLFGTASDFDLYFTEKLSSFRGLLPFD